MLRLANLKLGGMHPHGDTADPGVKVVAQNRALVRLRPLPVSIKSQGKGRNGLSCEKVMTDLHGGVV